MIDTILLKDLNQNYIKIENPQFYWNVETGRVSILLDRDIEIRLLKSLSGLRQTEAELKDLYESNNVKDWIDKKNQNLEKEL